MSSFDLMPELAARLERLLPSEPGPGDWGDVLRRAAPARVLRRPWPIGRLAAVTRRRRLSIAVAAAFLVLALAAVATATYLALRRSAAHPAPSPAEVSVIKQGPERVTQPDTSLAKLVVADSAGRLHMVWECPERTWCGTLTSIAWSPDGRRLAMTLSEIGGRSGYVGLHVIDLATGVDEHLGSLRIPHVEREQPTAILRRLVAASTKALGCPVPHEVSWAPDSKRLAYVCGNDLLNVGVRTSIYVIRADGTGRVRLRTGTFAAYSPSWSRDGTRIAFATQARPDGSAVYSVRLGGTDRMLLARNASAPAWSPDGKTIAYDAPCGVRYGSVPCGCVRLMTPTGDPAAPAGFPDCVRVIGGGRPAWSPDGSQLAVEQHAGVDVVNLSDGARHRATSVTGEGAYGVGRAAWAPAQALALLGARGHGSGL